MAQALSDPIREAWARLGEDSFGGAALLVGVAAYGLVDVFEEFGRHSIELLAVVPGGEEDAKRDPEDESG